MKHIKIFLLLLVLTHPINAHVKTQFAAAEEAIKRAQSEVDNNPDAAEAHFKLGEAYLSHSYSMAGKAAKSFLQATKLNPDYAEAYYKLALAYDRDHRHKFVEQHPEKEIKALRKAIELKPDYAEAYLLLARTYMKNPTWPDLNLEETYKPALELLNKAIELNPDLTDVYYELGKTYKVLKEDEKAQEAFEKWEKLKQKNQS
jgi:tetratricopeptide (TPR) repeat protein